MAVITAAGGVVGAVASGAPDAPAPSTLRVSGVDLTARVRSFDARCPLTLTFHGRIDVEGGSGEVVYRWLRTDDVGETETGSLQSLPAEGARSAEVTDEWTAEGARR
ncbi:MAG: hypothetical protein JWN17_1528 [Frankiales bacterium]|nr:hypothetical protein [Frankiales bacterium]